MFGFKKKKEVHEEYKPELIAPCDGKILKVEELSDPVFSGKVLGDGFAIDPTSNEVKSPVSGKIIDVQDSLHAYGIETPDGLQILVHIGINTVSLNGEGFKAKVKLNQNVKAGDLLAIADFDLIKKKGFEIPVVTLITDIDDVKSFKVNGVGTNARGGETVVLTYEK